MYLTQSMAALSALKNTELAEIYKSDGFSLRNYSSLTGVQWQEIVNIALSVGFIKYVGKDINEEDSYTLCSEQERNEVGERRFVGYGKDGSTIVINKDNTSELCKYIGCLNDKKYMDELDDNDMYSN